MLVYRESTGMMFYFTRWRILFYSKSYKTAQSRPCRVEGKEKRQLPTNASFCDLLTCEVLRPKSWASRVIITLYCLISYNKEVCINIWGRTLFYLVKNVKIFCILYITSCHVACVLVTVYIGKKLFIPYWFPLGRNKQ